MHPLCTASFLSAQLPSGIPCWLAPSLTSLLGVCLSVFASCCCSHTGLMFLKHSRLVSFKRHSWIRMPRRVFPIPCFLFLIPMKSLLTPHITLTSQCLTHHHVVWLMYKNGCKLVFFSSPRWKYKFCSTLYPQCIKQWLSFLNFQGDKTEVRGS